MLPDGSGRDVLFDWKLKDTWKQMEDLLGTGKVKSIGVSNFSQKKLEEEILPYATVTPAVDQVSTMSFSLFAELCRGLIDLSLISLSFIYTTRTTNSWSTSSQRGLSQKRTLLSGPPEPHFSMMK